MLNAAADLLFSLFGKTGGGGDLFAHRMEIQSTGQRPVLIKGMKVLYEPGTGRDGRPCAAAITNSDGSPIENEVAQNSYGGYGSGVPVHAGTGMKAMGVVRRW